MSYDAGREGKESGRQAYASPKLEVFGEVSALTASGSLNIEENSGGGGGNLKKDGTPRP
ncbi:hypothetical protein [Antarctobacter jejuensis]|uniref:hypothetical protein n=1 Tax=Antarctobacter jejuensis TaxID=1439938 RepID=UPI003FD37D6C